MNLSTQSIPSIIIFVLVAAAVGLFTSKSLAGPTAEEYVSKVGNGARIIAAGRLKIDGIRMSCGRRPTVLDDTLDDYGAAYPGFIILNPKLMGQISTPVKLWIYAHECAHQFRGPDEETADCFAVQRGRRQGLLSPGGVDEICNFIKSAKGDWMHISGPNRCRAMKKCYFDRAIY
jgi:hypothetical protein